MNISSNFSPANFLGTGPGKLARKPNSPARANASQPGGDLEPDGFPEVASEPAKIDSASIPKISDVASAQEQVVFLKNAMLALPALVLRGQGNLVRQSVAQLLKSQG
jgi:hypothetical protein